MEQVGRAGIATFVMRGKEYLVAIFADNGILRAETLRFADEVRSPGDVDLPEPQEPPAAVVKKLEKAIAALSKEGLDEGDLADRSAERLRELVARKERTGEDVVSAPEGVDPPPSDGVIDLMEVLKRSLQGGGTARAPKTTGSGSKASSGSRSKTTGSRSKASTGSGSKASSGRPRSAKAKNSRARAAKTGRSGGDRNGAAAGDAGRDPGLADLSKDELYEKAKALDIPGRSGMTKDALVRAIRNR
jgi:DNA end-binding protein Ku